MTLFQAAKYDPSRERWKALLVPILLVLVLLGAFLTWYLWNWPEEHVVNRFFQAIEHKDMEKAYAIWNADTEWKQHPDKYKNYTFGAFTIDWGPSSEWGTISSHHIDAAKSQGTGVIVAVRLNGISKRAFLWVERKDRSLSFSPYELRIE